MTISERIAKLRQQMKQNHIDAYIIPSADYHQSEYVGEFFKTRAFITGFTGSAGTAIITQNEAGLWTDGRYFIQAERELLHSEIQLHKIGVSNALTIDVFLSTTLPQRGSLGFDGKVLSATEGKHYKQLLSDKNVNIIYEYDLIDSIWDTRPSLPKEPVFFLPERYSGESTSSKLKRIRYEMQKTGATMHLLTTLDDIAWLLNIRGNDVAYTPVVLCYAIITMQGVLLFIDIDKLSDEIIEILKAEGIFFYPYDDIYSFVKTIDEKESILLDPSSVNYTLYHSIPAGIKRIENLNPSKYLKAIKNDVEIANIRNAHIKDAIAHTKFMHWVKTQYVKQELTELSASDQLEAFRAKQPDFLGPSFSPISAFGANAALCHYSSSKETNTVLKPGALFLTDTGAHYLDGSTDITRTIALGTISSELKQHFTNVLRGNLALSKAKFLHGCTGENLDILARQYLWNMHLDYKHGTGHGIGYLLSIHEGPCSIKWQYRQAAYPLEAGMVLSNEPGIYIENSHGIRLENELLVCKDMENEHGQFMQFEILTYVPFDLDAIDISLLNEEEKSQLNDYHKLVYDIVSPHLTGDEKIWLKKYTRAI